MSEIWIEISTILFCDTCITFEIIIFQIPFSNIFQSIQISFLWLLDNKILLLFVFVDSSINIIKKVSSIRYIWRYFCPFTLVGYKSIIHISFSIFSTHVTRIPSVNFSITLWNFCYSLRSLSYLPRLEHCYSCKLRKPLTNLPFTFCIPNEDICITLLTNFIICFYRQQNFAIDRYFKPFLNLQKEVNVNSSFEALYLKGVKLDRWILFMKSLLHTK